MNEYIVQGQSWLGTDSNLVLTSNTDALESGGFFARSERNWRVTSDYKLGCIDINAAARLTIGGNFSKNNNVAYEAQYVALAVQAIGFNTTGGSIYTAAQTGAVSAKSQATDGAITIGIAKTFNSEKSTGALLDSQNPAVYNGEASAVGAVGQFSANGSLGGQFGFISINDCTQAWRVNTKGDFVSAYRDGIDMTMSAIRVKEYVGADKKTVVQAQFIVENNIIANLSGLVNGKVAAIELDKSAASVSNNTVAGYGYFIEGGSAAGFSLFSVANGYMGGSISLSKEQEEEEEADGDTTAAGSGSSLPKADEPTTPGAGEGEGEGEKENPDKNWTVFRHHTKNEQSAVAISGNRSGLYGVSANKMAINRYTGVMNIANTKNKIEGVEGKVSDSSSTTISNNKFESIGFDGALFSITGEFAGELNISTMENYIYFLDGGNKRYSSGNEISAYGIRLVGVSSGKEYQAGALESSRNFRGTINVENSISDMTPESALSANQTTYVSKTYGIYAESSISIAGGFSSTIVSNSLVVTNSNKNSVNVGVYASSISAQYFGGSIKVAADWTTSGNGVRRCVGIYAAESLLNDNDKIFDITGSIEVAGGSINACVWGGRATGIKIRLSGSLKAGDGAMGGTTDFRYAVFAGIIDENYVNIRYATDDYVELAAGSSTVGDIELFNGDNAMVVDSNASYYGSIYTTFGTLNMEFRLNSKMFRGEAQSGNLICNMTDDSTLLTSTTTITVNLDDAKEGETYILVGGTLDLDRWAERQISVSYQGETYTTTIGGVASGKYFQVSTNISDGKIALTVDKLVANSLTAVTVGDVKQDAKKDLVTLNWNAAADTSYYLLEYSLDGGNTIVVKVDGDKNSLDIKAIDIGTKVEWRIRRYSVNNLVSDWTSVQSFVVNVPSANIKDPDSTSYDSETGNAGSSVINLDWKTPESSYGIEYYEVQYYTSPDNVAPDWSSATVFTKKVTGTDVLVSGLSNLDYVFWRVRAVDVKGNIGNWAKGDTLRVYAGDTTAPEFDVKSVTAVVKFVESGIEETPVMMQVDLTWKPAVEIDGKSGVAGYQISYRIAGSKDAWTSVRFDGKATSGTIGLLKNGVYEWKMQAVDYAGNKTPEYPGVNWTGDYLAPIFKYGENLEAEIVAGNRTNNITLSWNEASDGNALSSYQSGMKEYILYYKAEGAADSTAKKIKLTDLSTSYELDSKTAKLADGKYVWWIEAYDNMDNVTKTGNSTFQVDTSAPVGGRSEISGPVISVTWKNVTTTSPLGVTFTESVVDTISVSFTVTGSYTDVNDIYYVMQCSDNSNFSGNVYEYKAKYTGNTTTITFNDSFELGAGGLAKLGTVYFRMQAVDAIGNETGAWSYFGKPFKMVDPVTNKVITDTVAPTQVTGAALLREDKQLTFSWNAATDAMGVKSYEISFSNKTTGKTEKVTGIDKLKYVTSTLAEGKYTWMVSAVDWYGQRGAWSTKADFIVDVTAPVFDVTSLAVSVLNRDVCLTWSKATDNIEVAGYELVYSIWDSQLGGFFQSVTTKVAATETSFWFNNWADGRYSYQIRAYDSVGNTSSWSSTQYATVDTADDPGSTIAKAKEWFWGTSFSNIVGRTDTADFLRFSLDEAGMVTFSIDGISAAENNNAGVTVTVYNASGSKVKTISLTPGKTGELSMLMEKGNCYVAFTPNSGGNHNAVNYTVNGKVDYFPAASSNSSFATAATVKLDADGLGSFSGWVGYGDPADYFKVNAAAAGTMQYIEFREVTSNLTVSIYDASGNQLKSYTVSANGKNYTSQLVPNGAYVVVKSGDGGKGNMNSSYSANIKLDYFPTPSGNGSFDTAAVVTIDEKGSGKANGWVGYGDAVDYYKVNLSHSATLDYISISGISSQVTVSIYDSNRNLIKSVSTNKAGQLFSKQLLAGTFYVSVSSGDGGKGGMNTSYEITGGGAYMPEPTSNNSFSTAFTVTLDNTGKGSFGDWVGYGDPSCYYHVVADRAGAVDISIAGLEGKVTVALYDENRKLIKQISTDSSKVLFSSQLITGSFYVSVSSGDNGKGKDNSGFTVTVEDDYFTAPSGNSSFATAQKVALNGSGVAQFTGWVGYGDPIDYYLVEATEAGSLNLTISGLASGTTVTLYDEYYRIIKSVKASGDAKLFADQLVAGKFYVSVESGDKGKGKQNTNYTVSVEDRYFPANNGHNDFKNAQAVDLTVGADGKAVAGVTGWVGYGDAADFYKFSPTNAGSFSLSISGLENGVKVAVYDANGKQIKSVTAKGAGVVFSNILLSGPFYVSVTSGDNGKGKQNTDYKFDVVDDYFPAATDNNTFRTATAVVPSADGVFTASGWVGYGDAADYYVIESASAGELELTISGVEAGMKITVYDANGKQMKSGSVSASGKVAADLLVPGKFYISVTSGDNGKGKQNTGYEITGGISYFPAATDNNAFSTAKAITVVDGSAVEAGWVGYGDAANFYVFNGTGAGSINTITISGLTGKVTVTVYDADRKAVKKITTAANGQLFDNLLFKGKFYISVESGDKGKGKENTHYELSGAGSYFPAATDNNRFANATVVELGAGAASVTGWVGYGDSADFYKFVGTGAGTLDISGSGFGAKAVITVYDANGKKLKNISASKDAKITLSGLLSAGTFYISVESGDKGKGKENTDYTIEVNDKYFPAATANNTFAAAEAVTLESGAGTVTGWVGYGDAADYYLVSAGSSGQLSLTVGGVEGKLNISVYDVNRKKLKNVSVNSDKLAIEGLLVNGSYYLVVESADKGKGKENSNYTITVNDELFPAATPNSDFKSAQSVVLTDGAAATEGWVGYGDAVDYYLLGTENSGTLSLSLSGLKAGVVVSVYDSSTKQLKKVTVKADGTAVADLLTSGRVYVSVASGDNGKGKQNTAYVLNAAYSAFPAPTGNNSIAAATKVTLEDGAAAVAGWVGYGDAANYYLFDAGSKSGNMSLTVSGVEKSARITVYDAGGKRLDSETIKGGTEFAWNDLLFSGKIYVSIESGDNGKGKENTSYKLAVSAGYFPEPSKNSTFSTAENITFSQSGSQSVSGWVGYNDAADYYKLNLPLGGTTTMSLSGLEAKTVIRVYDVNYKSLGSHTVTGSSWSLSGETDAGIVYIAIESGDKGKGSMNTGYTLKIESSFVAPESGHNDRSSALVLDVASGAATGKGVVGKENMTDFFSFDLASSGSVDLKLNVAETGRELGTDMNWAIYDSNGNKQLISDWQNTQSLEAGLYYASVEMINESKWASYNISVTIK